MKLRYHALPPILHPFSFPLFIGHRIPFLKTIMNPFDIRHLASLVNLWAVSILSSDQIVSRSHQLVYATRGSGGHYPHPCLPVANAGHIVRH